MKERAAHSLIGYTKTLQQLSRGSSGSLQGDYRDDKYAERLPKFEGDETVD